MTPQRIVFLIVLTLQGACITAAHQDLIPKWTPFLALAGTVLTALMASIAPAKDAPPPKLPLVLLLLGAAALAGSTTACAALAKDAQFLPSPSQSECVLNGVDQGLPALTIITSCGLEMNAIAFVESLLVGKKRQAAHRAAMADDGGAPKTLNFANDNDAGKR